jgi:hypothetical protein
MAPTKAGGRARRKGSAGLGEGGRTAEKVAGPGGGVTMVDLDPWGAFFERFWEQAAEAEAPTGAIASGDRPRARTAGAKPTKQRRSPRVS